MGSSQPSKEEKPLYFKGFGMGVGLSDSSGLNAVGDNYENDWLLILLPTWKTGRLFFNDIAPLRSLTLSGRWILSGEFSGSSDTYRTGEISPTANYSGCDTSAPSGMGGVVSTSSIPYCQNGAQRRLDYSDIILKATDKVYTIPVVNIDIIPGVAGTLPISAQSQYAHLVTALQGAVGLSRSFLDEKLVFTYGFAATKFFHSSNVPVIDYTTDPIQDPNNPQLNTPGSTSTSSDLSRFADGAGGMVASYSLIHQFAASYTLNSKLTFSALYIISDSFRLAVPTCNTYLGAGVGTVNSCANGAVVAESQGATVLDHGDSGSQIFRLGAEYQLNDYLSADIGLLSVSPQRHPNGTWQQPFITTDYNNYSSVNIGITLVTEALAAAVVHPN